MNISNVSETEQFSNQQADNKATTKLRKNKVIKHFSYRNAKFAFLALVILATVGSSVAGRVFGESQYIAPQARLENPIEEPKSQPIDAVVAAEVSALAAERADLLVTTSVTNRADTLSAQINTGSNTSTDTSSAISDKPQVVASDLSSRSIQRIKVKDGDSVKSLALEYGISEDTIRWANSLGSDDLTPGVELVILPVSGVLHTVQTGDTAESLADKYKTTADQIITFNDLEVNKLKTGNQIVIPGGIMPASTVTTATGPAAVTPSAGSSSTQSSSSFSYGTGVLYAGNRYAYGYCTYYAYNKRAAAGRVIGSNWGNATTWAALARASGFSVDNNPRAGDVFQTSGGWGGYGHVGYVEKVNSDGSVLVSEMNYAGWNVVSSRTLSASEVPSYKFIH